MSKLSECYAPNIMNPMMNFLPFDNRTRNKACTVEKLDNSNSMIVNGNNNNTTTSNITTDNNIFNIPRAYTMPVTSSMNDTMGLAKFLYPNPARCRETGYMCKTNADMTYNLDRLAYYPNDSYYQTITNPSASQLEKDIMEDIVFR
jgi:hypothetical protein